MDVFEPGEVSLEDYLRAAPTDEESAHAAVAAHVHATVEERWEAFHRVLGEADALLSGAAPFTGEPDPFWRRWVDPLVGRPR